MSAFVATSSGTLSVAPNASYGVPSGTNPPPFASGGTGSTEPLATVFSVVPEAATVQWANNNAPYVLGVMGWIDNI